VSIFELNGFQGLCYGYKLRTNSNIIALLYI